MAKKRKRYSDVQRADAVVMLEGAGYPDTKGSLQAVSDRLNIPGSTLHRWFHKIQNPPPSHLVSEKRGEMVKRLPDVMHLVLDEIIEAIKDAPLNHLATTYGILDDKHTRLSGNATEVIEHRDNTDHITELKNRLAGLDGRSAQPGTGLPQ